MIETVIWLCVLAAIIVALALTAPYHNRLIEAAHARDDAERPANTPPA
jgi:hypothetical protein